MKTKFLPAAILIAAATLLVATLPGAEPEKGHLATTVSLRKLADSLHKVIAADRESYARLVVQRLALEEKRLEVTENWLEQRALPTHAQMLRLTAQNIQKRGAEFSYALRSLWPINPNHGPQTEIEQLGLEFVASHPGTNYYTEELLGGRSYFTAIYPDRATLSSCVDCHNRHPASPRRDFKTDDVMGALIIRVPLEF
ncbi:MAG: DUF3365 domain-containing protein [Verrucomicrobia bacterium]|nr:DUF3365 domain-containing protein [Verrucomicrobiota bacterium]